MSDDKERFIFRRELTRLYDDCKRCEEIRIREEIFKDINLLKEAIELLSP